MKKTHKRTFLLVPSSSAKTLERAEAKAKGDKRANPNCYSHSRISLTTRPIVASVTMQFTPNGLNKTIFAFPLEHDIQRKKRRKKHPEEVKGVKREACQKE